MANICSCCGEKIPYLDVAYDLIEIDGKDYFLCSNCSKKFLDYKKGAISLEKITNDFTEPKIRQYFLNNAPDSEVVQKVKHQEKKEEEKIQRKLMAQENDPLYDDIHQIAGDLRFIKNIIIFGLICSVVLGIIGILDIM